MCKGLILGAVVAVGELVGRGGLLGCVVGIFGGLLVCGEVGAIWGDVEGFGGDPLVI